jgi:protein-L-isoaspartate(D-aspartate) O-methyltransferase
MGDVDHAGERRGLVEHLRRRTDVSGRTLSAIAAVPRHEFVPEADRAHAYADRPLPIGHDQTISAPHMVAVMVDLLEVSSGDRVFEVGTGCGYHAAVVAEIVGPGNVYSVEYVPELADAARDRLDRLGYDVTVRAGDGRTAFAECAPFDAAYLTCAAPGDVPDEIVERTRTGGHVVAPVESNDDAGSLLESVIGGRSGASQRLVRLTVRDGGVDREDHGAVRFVPMR